MFPFPAATEWFDEQPGHGVAGEPSVLYPSAESLEQAKQECLMEHSVCAAVLQTGTGFYLISSMDSIVAKPDSTLYRWTSKWVLLRDRKRTLFVSSA